MSDERQYNPRVTPPETVGFGDPVPRVEDERFLRGSGRYVGDLDRRGLLWMIVVRSPHAHARIRRVDLQAARGHPGVAGVWSGADLRGDWVAPLPMVWPVTDDIRIPDHRPLAADAVRHVGDGVAVVAAESLAAAKDAAEQVRVDYDVLPAVAGIEEALAEGAPLVHESFGTNVCFETTYARGDVDGIFRDAEVVVRRRYRQQRVIPSPMEGRAVLAEPSPGPERFVVWTSTQLPHVVRTTLAECVGLPEGDLRVVAPDVGGAFGAKLNVYAEEALALALARRLGRPVKWVEERSESHAATTHGRGQVQDVEIAATSEGDIRGIRVRLHASMGAYLQLETPGVPTLGMFLYGGLYRAEVYSVTCVGVFTNQTPTDSYRGAGRPEAVYAIERGIEALASEVGSDPVAIRRRNFLPSGDHVESAAGPPYDSLDASLPFDRALQLAGYDRLRSEQRRRREARASVELGIGLSCYVESGGAGPSGILAASHYRFGGWETGRVRFTERGDVEVLSGTSPQGQGHVTAWKQLVSAELGVPMEAIAVRFADTAVVPAGQGAFGSRSLAVGGTAIYLAVQKVLAKTRIIAAHVLGAGEDELELRNGCFYGSNGSEVSIQDVARAAYAAGDLPDGVEPGIDEMVVYDPPGFTHSFGAHVAVVEVDTETGRVALLRYVAVDDCGRVLNPLLVDAQIRGGIAQGVGQALLEEAVYAKDGRLVTDSLLSYTLPSAADLPSFTLGRTVTPSPVNPLGAKGTGEAGAIAAPAAVMNAVLDAVGPRGVDHLDMPATPATVWRALVEGAG
jgi:carbon-monoxide dehydrogenase large subunit